MVAGLNEFSREVAESLFRAFPWLKPHGVVDDNPKVTPGSLLIRLAPTPGIPERLFSVSTHGGEITVAFDMFLTHFEWPDDSEELVSFIDDLAADRVLIKVRMADGKWTGSETLDAAEASGSLASAEGETVCIRSWTGARDAEFSDEGRSRTRR